MLKIRNLSIKKINEYDRNKYNDYFRTENTKYTLDWRSVKMYVYVNVHCTFTLHIEGYMFFIPLTSNSPSEFSTSLPNIEYSVTHWTFFK
jgi:hypothetical protein